MLLTVWRACQRQTKGSSALDGTSRKLIDGKFAEWSRKDLTWTVRWFWWAMPSIEWMVEYQPMFSDDPDGNECSVAIKRLLTVLHLPNVSTTNTSFRQTQTQIWMSVWWAGLCFACVHIAILLLWLAMRSIGLTKTLPWLPCGRSATVFQVPVAFWHVERVRNHH